MSNVLALRPIAPAVPNIENRNVLPTRRRNAELRTREYLTPDEVERLVDHTRKLGRHGHRDATLIASPIDTVFWYPELIALRWEYDRPEAWAGSRSTDGRTA